MSQKLPFFDPQKGGIFGGIFWIKNPHLLFSDLETYFLWMKQNSLSLTNFKLLILNEFCLIPLLSSSSDSISNLWATGPKSKISKRCLPF